MTVRNLLDGVEVLVCRGNLHATAPAHGAEIVLAVGIGNFGPVDVNGVVMETLVQWPRVADPGTVLTLRERAAVFETDRDVLRVGCHDPETDAPFRIDLGIVLAGLIG